VARRVHVARKLRPRSSGPVSVSYGAGVDSTAILVRMVQLGLRPDYIIFADTGGEKPWTYRVVVLMDQWLRSVGFPGVTAVRYLPGDLPYRTLEGNCLRNDALPSLAYFNRHSCSEKWKHTAIEEFLLNQAEVQASLYEGNPVVTIIGYEDGAADRTRYDNFIKERDRRIAAGDVRSRQFEYWYPMIQADWGPTGSGITRQQAVELIEAEIGGLFEKASRPYFDGGFVRHPGKSSCFYCPAMHAEEIGALCQMSAADGFDDGLSLALRGAAMEYRAIHGKLGLIHEELRGLGISWMWQDYLSCLGYLPPDPREWGPYLLDTGFLPDGWPAYEREAMKVRLGFREADETRREGMALVKDLTDSEREKATSAGVDFRVWMRDPAKRGRGKPGVSKDDYRRIRQAKQMHKAGKQAVRPRRGLIPPDFRGNPREPRSWSFLKKHLRKTWVYRVSTETAAAEDRRELMETASQTASNNPVRPCLCGWR